jgi:hypothetical protein
MKRSGYYLAFGKMISPEIFDRLKKKKLWIPSHSHRTPLFIVHTTVNISTLGKVSLSATQATRSLALRGLQ